MITTGGAVQNFAYSLHGMDPKCANGPGPAALSCGIHIHVGKSCEEDALGHYWNHEFVKEDPWSHIDYHVVGTGAHGHHVVPTGLTEEDILGHAVIIHDYEGTRVACAILNTVVGH
jgi:hypothetical protein